MTPYSKRNTPITQRMAEDMQVRNFSPRTIDSYTYHVDRYAKHFGKDPVDLGPEDVRNFQLWMIREKKSSWSQFNQAVCGLRFFYSITCKREWVVSHIPFGHVPKKLPNVLGSDEVASLISCITHTKHLTVVIVLYAAGLRLSEALNLKLQDIDSARMQLKVVQGKGRKDRYVPISPRLLTALRIYWAKFRPTSFLFPGLTHEVPLNGAVIQKVVTLAAAKARINKHVTPHTLRHSYATGLLEAGVDLMAISKLLGHSSFTTTMVYLHCRKQHLSSTPSPLDWLPVKQCPLWVDPSLQTDLPKSKPNLPSEPMPPELQLPPELQPPQQEQQPTVRRGRKKND